MIGDAYQFPQLVLPLEAKNVLEQVFQHYSLSDSKYQVQWWGK